MSSRPHEQRTQQRLPYLPALDGLRALALLAVLAFHGGIDGVDGGYLPLTSFFVLSGFLITSLLLLERRRTGSIDLASFWARRARRLAPGAVLGLGVVGAYVAFGASYEVPGLEGDVLASLTWVTNWRFILDGRAYADVLADPSPLQHYWSLAVEEQFYVVLPLLAAGLLALGRGRRWPFAAAIAALAAASVTAMRLLHDPGDVPLRAYFGTDTRAAELLVGVLLACVLVGPTGLRQASGWGRRALDGAGVAALVASVWTWLQVGEYDDRLYEGGLVGIALLAAIVVAAAANPGTVVARVLSVRPLVWLGAISYGVYLFHWPLFLWLDEQRTGLGTEALFALRLAVTVVLAWLSWRFVEAPIRAGRLRSPVAPVAWLNASTAVAACVVALAAALPGTGTTLLATDGRDETAAPPPPPTTASARDTGSTPSSVTTVVPTTSTSAPAVASAPVGEVAGRDAGTPAAPVDGAPGPAAPPTTTAPTTATTVAPLPPLRIMVVGDSMARNLAKGLASWGTRTGLADVYDASVLGCPLEGGGQRYLQNGDPWSIPPGCDWWKEGFAPNARAYDPDVIVVHTGTNEIYDREHPDWEGRRAPGDPIFDRYLLDGYLGFVDVLSGQGVPVVWAVPPCNRWDPRLYDEATSAQRLGVITDVTIPALQSARSIELAALDEQLCPGGQFSDRVAGVDGARPDGYHLTDEASDRLAETWLGPVLAAAVGRG